MTDAALDFAVAESYDHVYGARPLRRWLEHRVITPLSRMIISGQQAGMESGVEGRGQLLMRP